MLLLYAISIVAFAALVWATTAIVMHVRQARRGTPETIAATMQEGSSIAASSSVAE